MQQKHFAPITRSLAVCIFVITMAILFVVALFTPELHLLPLWFNPYAILYGTFVAVAVALLLVMLRGQMNTDEGLWLYLFLVILVVVVGAGFMQVVSAHPEGALFWANVGTPAAAFGPVVFMFAVRYTNQSERRFHFLGSLLLTGSFLFIFFSNFTNIIFNNSSKAAILEPWGWDFTQAVGPAIALSLLWYIGFIGLAIARLISFRRHSKNKLLRQQSLIFILSLGVTTILGIMQPLILPIFHIALPPISSVVSLVVAGSLIYGVLKYQILNVDPLQFAGTILTLMREAVIVTDEDYAVVYLNPTAEGLLGGLTGKRQFHLFKSFSEASASKLQQALKEAGSSETFEIEQLDVTSHDKQVPVHITGSRLKVGKYETWIMILTDITKELQTRGIIEHEVQVRTRELHEARAYLVSSINSLEQGFLLVNQSSKLQLSNSVAERIFKLDSTAMNKPAAEVIKAPTWDADLGHIVGEVLETRRSQQADVTTTTGSFFTLYVTPILAGSQLLGATVVVEDVTEQKILDRSKDEFFSIASHELRTPLTAIRGNSGMIKDYFPEAMKDESLAGMIDDMHESSVRLIEIVNDFLDSSRLEQGKMEFELKPFKIASVIESAQNDLKQLTQQQGNTIVLEHIDKAPEVLADEGRFRQIIYNVLSNANKYSEHATITISADVDGSRLKMSVADTGKGISPENQKLLFHKFQQASDSTLTRDNTKGTGLGLYISKLLAQNMHGDVVLEHSEEGKGSVFAITLPLAGKK